MSTAAISHLPFDVQIQFIAKSGVSFADAVKSFRYRFLVAVLNDNRWNVCASARKVGLHRNTLSRQMAELGITVPRSARRPRKLPISLRSYPSY